MTAQQYVESRRNKTNKFLYMNFYACAKKDTTICTLTNNDFVLSSGQQYNAIQSFSVNVSNVIGTSQAYTAAVSLKVFSMQHLKTLYSNAMQPGCRIILHVYTNPTIAKNILNNGSINDSSLTNNQPSQLIVDFNAYNFTITNDYDQVFSVTISGFVTNNIPKDQTNLSGRVKDFYQQKKQQYEVSKDKKTKKKISKPIYMTVSQVFKYFNIDLVGVSGIKATLRYQNDKEYNIDISKIKLQDRISISIKKLKEIFTMLKDFATKNTITSAIFNTLTTQFNYYLNDTKIIPYFHYSQGRAIMQKEIPKDAEVTFAKNRQTSDIIQMTYGLNIQQQNLISVQQSQSIKQEKQRTNTDNNTAIQKQYANNDFNLTDYLKLSTQQLDITVEGLSGLNINSLVKFNEGDFFIKNMIFRITQIQHIVNPGKWLTKIKAYGMVPRD